MVIVSSPLGFIGTTIQFEEITFPSSLEGTISYVGHPATKALLEALGAVSIPGKWQGPQIGEVYLAVPLAQNTREAGWTHDQAIESIAELKAIQCTRIA